MMSANDDILNFLREGKSHPFVLRSWKWPGPIKSRALAFYGLLKRQLSLSEVVNLMLPGRYKGKRLRYKFSGFINAEVEKAISRFIGDDDSVYVFGEKFYKPFNSATELFDLIFQIIYLDQYNARKLLRGDSVVIDAGANIGTFSVLAGNLSPAGHIYAFEPVKGTFDILKKNTSSYENTSCFNCALGEENTERNMFVFDGVTGGNVMEDSKMLRRYSKDDFGSSEAVKITTIDDFVEKNNVPRVNFIKIDTKGYEAKILNGAKKTIQRFKPIIVASAYHNKGDKELLPRIVKSVDPNYKYKLENIFEEDIVFTYESKENGQPVEK